MMYWIVFATFSALEVFADIFISFWCPFYYELKILFVIYLLTPYTKGASVLYRKVRASRSVLDAKCTMQFIHPLLLKHEEEIDQLLDQAKESSVNTMMRLGSQVGMCRW